MPKNPGSVFIILEITVTKQISCTFLIQGLQDALHTPSRHGGHKVFVLHESALTLLGKFKAIHTYMHHKDNSWVVFSLLFTTASFEGTNLRQSFYIRNIQTLLNCQKMSLSLWMRNFTFKISDLLMQHFDIRSSSLWLAYLYTFNLGRLLLWVLIKYYLLNISFIADYLSVTSYSKNQSMLSIKCSRINDIMILKLLPDIKYCFTTTKYCFHSRETCLEAYQDFLFFFFNEKNI